MNVSQLVEPFAVDVVWVLICFVYSCVCAAMMNDGAGRLCAHPGVVRCARISVMFVGLGGNAAS